MTASDQFVEELFDPDRHVRFTFHPQTTCAFAAKNNAGMLRALSGGRFAQTVDRLEKCRSVKDLDSIRDNIRSSLYRGFHVYAPFAQSLQKAVAMRLRDPRSRRTTGVESIRNELSKGIQKDFVVRTEKDFVMTGSRGIRTFAEVQRTADESLTRKNCFNSRQQIGLGVSLMNIGLSAHVKSLPDDIGGRFLADEDDFCAGSKAAYLPRGF